MRPSGLFIGRATMDVVSLVDRFPEPDEKISARRILCAAGGPALNAAITFAHLGGEATLVSSFGTDPFAAAALDECRRHRVATIDLAAERPFAFPVSMVISARADASRCIVNSPPAPAAAPTDANASVPLVPPRPPPDIVLLDQFEADAASTLAPPLRAAGVPIVLDGGGWKPRSPGFLDLATIPIVSSRFRPPDGRSPPDNRGQYDMAAWFESSRFVRWAVTRGARGVTYGEAGRTRHLEAIPVEAIDTSAAGDIFHGAFCFAYAERRSFAEALGFAAAVAAQSCRYAGPRAWMTETGGTFSRGR